MGLFCKKELVVKPVAASGFCAACGGNFRQSALKQVPQFRIYKYLASPATVVNAYHCKRCQTADFNIILVGYESEALDTRAFKVDGWQIQMLDRPEDKPKAKAKK